MHMHIKYLYEILLIADTDFGMFIEDYDIRVKRIFLGNKRMWLRSVLGHVDEGMEIKTYNGFFNHDIFFLYKANKTHMWNGYHGSSRLYKYYLVN